MSKLKLVFLAFVLAAFACWEHVDADLFYTVDNSTNELFTIDSNNGQVSLVGSTNLELHDSDLAFLNGNLYATSSDFGLQIANLIQINTSTGHASLLSNLNSGGTNATIAEGLTAWNNRLYVGFTPNANDTDSSFLGVAQLNGEIFDAIDYNVDMDGLAVDPLGQFYAADGFQDVSQIHRDIYTINPTDFVGRTSGSIGFNDLEFSNGKMYAIGFNTLHELDPMNGQVIDTISLSRSGEYRGLSVAVPEPSAFLMIGIAFVGLTGLRKRRTV